MKMARTFTTPRRQGRQSLGGRIEPILGDEFKDFNLVALTEQIKRQFRSPTQTETIGHDDPQPPQPPPPQLLPLLLPQLLLLPHELVDEVPHDDPPE